MNRTADLYRPAEGSPLDGPSSDAPDSYVADDHPVLEEDMTPSTDFLVSDGLTPGA